MRKPLFGAHAEGDPSGDAMDEIYITDRADSLELDCLTCPMPSANTTSYCTRFSKFLNKNEDYIGDSNLDDVDVVRDEFNKNSKTMWPCQKFKEYKNKKLKKTKEVPWKQVGPIKRTDELPRAVHGGKNGKRKIKK